jgi:hypothetical protein
MTLLDTPNWQLGPPDPPNCNWGGSQIAIYRQNTPSGTPPIGNRPTPTLNPDPRGPGFGTFLSKTGHTAPQNVSFAFLGVPNCQLGDPPPIDNRTPPIGNRTPPIDNRTPRLPFSVEIEPHRPSELSFCPFWGFQLAGGSELRGGRRGVRKTIKKQSIGIDFDPKN